MRLERQGSSSREHVRRSLAPGGRRVRAILSARRTLIETYVDASHRVFPHPGSMLRRERCVGDSWKVQLRCFEVTGFLSHDSRRSGKGCVHLPLICSESHAGESGPQLWESLQSTSLELGICAFFDLREANDLRQAGIPDNALYKSDTLTAVNCLCLVQNRTSCLGGTGCHHMIGFGAFLLRPSSEGVRLADFTIQVTSPETSHESRLLQALTPSVK